MERPGSRGDRVGVFVAHPIRFGRREGSRKDAGMMQGPRGGARHVCRRKREAARRAGQL